MERTRIVGHNGTDVNYAWSIDRVTGSYANVDEYQFQVGERTLTFDPRHAPDRAQMAEIAQALTSALTVATLEHLEADDEDEDEDLCPDGEEHPADYCHKYNCPNYITHLQDLAPWGTSRAGLKGWAA
jgi:hypothetical protein